MKKNHNGEKTKIADDKSTFTEDDSGVVWPAYDVMRSDIFGR